VPHDHDEALTEAPPPPDPAGQPRSRRRRLLLIAGAAAIPALAFVLWWFQPQALLFDDVVDEEFPIGAANASADPTAEDADASAPSASGAEGPDAVDGPGTGTGAEGTADDPEPAEAETEASEPVELASGSFVSRNRYTVTGTATAYELEDGQRVLRLEDFESTNGPDLFVYLTVAGADDDDAALDAEFVDLGTLTGNIGDQNYVIPADVDLDRYDSVVIWCRRFTTSFGVADLASSL
jgi:hypothetical protein